MAKTMNQRRLGRLLSQLRNQTGQSFKAVSDDTAIMDRRTLSDLERGEVLVSWPQCVELAKHYGANAEEQQEVKRLALAARRKEWWEDQRLGMPDDFQQYIGMEREASRICICETEVLPGLLQTPDYMRAVMRDTSTDDPTVFDQQLRIRTMRQESIREDATIAVVVTEGALMREIGGRDVHRDQVKYLIDQASKGGLLFKVLPATSGVYRACGIGSFTVLEFGGTTALDVVYLETLDSCRYEEAEEKVARYSEVIHERLDQGIPLEEFLNV